MTAARSHEVDDIAAGPASAARHSLTSDEARHALFTMTLIRVFEERVLKLVGDGSIRGTTHACIGQEAVAVGACMALRAEDLVVSTHRGHGHLLAKGGSPERLMAELFGKVDGYGGGRGGTQHLADPAVGHLGSNGITGGGIPIGTGAALSAAMRRSGQVVGVFLGEGATNQGVFHESLNLAALWKLPVVYICENNLYAMSTHVAEAMAAETVAARASAYGMPAMRVDGMEVGAVAAAVREAAQRARAGAGPGFVECATYRFLGHSKNDQRVYRSREEEAKWRERDPIPRLRALALERNLLNSAEIEAIAAEASAAVDRAVDFARKSGFPAPHTVTDGLFASRAGD